MSASLKGDSDTARGEGGGRGGGVGRGSDGGINNNGVLGLTSMMGTCSIVEKDHDDPDVSKLTGTFSALLKAVGK